MKECITRWLPKSNNVHGSTGLLQSEVSGEKAEMYQLTVNTVQLTLNTVQLTVNTVQFTVNTSLDYILSTLGV